jgi:hypothetical protein
MKKDTNSTNALIPNKTTTMNERALTDGFGDHGAGRPRSRSTKKQLTVAATLGLAALFTMSLAPVGSAQTLTKVTIEFPMRHGDDRDHDTRTDVTIMKGSTIVASSDNVAKDEHLKDPDRGWKTYGPYDIPVRTAIPKSDYAGSIIAIADFPHGGMGHDTWITKVKVTAIFSYGPPIVTETRHEIKLVNKERKEIRVQ